MLTPVLHSVLDMQTNWPLSPLDGRYAEKVALLRPLMSEYGLMRYRVRIEVEWLLYLTNEKDIAAVAALPILSHSEQEAIRQIATDFNANDAACIHQIEQTTKHDVKAVEYFIRDKLHALSLPTLSLLVPFIHFACTSEDINNLAYALMLKDARSQVILPILHDIAEDLQAKVNEYAALPMLARTHGQAATPTTLGKEFANSKARLMRQIRIFEQVVILGKFNGAVGNYNAHRVAFPEIDWPEHSAHFVKSLGLTFNPLTTQIEPHDYIAELLHAMTRINTILLDLARDMWSYISIGYFNQKCVDHEVGSSTMPHKINPIDFENAEGNLGVANALNEHLALKLPISRWQRDLSDSTVLRNIGVTWGYSLAAYVALQQGLRKVEANQPRITKDLAQRWEVLAEAIQTIMRRYGIDDAYEQIKTLTRGKKLTAEQLTYWVQNQSRLPDAAKQALLALTPASYLGYATELAKMADKTI